jgi:hypothetical protein
LRGVKKNIHASTPAPEQSSGVYWLSFGKSGLAVIK